MHGDLSENADYDAAKERQGFIEGRISEVEQKLAHAQVLGGPTRSSATTRPTSGRARSRSIRRSRALIGKSEGDTAEVEAPGGVRSYEVVAVRYA